MIKPKSLWHHVCFLWRLASEEDSRNYCILNSFQPFGSFGYFGLADWRQSHLSPSRIFVPRLLPDTSPARRWQHIWHYPPENYSDWKASLYLFEMAPFFGTFVPFWGMYISNHHHGCNFHVPADTLEEFQMSSMCWCSISPAFKWLRSPWRSRSSCGGCSCCSLILLEGARTWINMGHGTP